MTLSDIPPLPGRTIPAVGKDVVEALVALSQAIASLESEFFDGVHASVLREAVALLRVLATEHDDLGGYGVLDAIESSGAIDMAETAMRGLSAEWHPSKEGEEGDPWDEWEGA